MSGIWYAFTTGLTSRVTTLLSSITLTLRVAMRLNLNVLPARLKEHAIDPAEQRANEITTVESLAPLYS